MAAGDRAGGFDQYIAIDWTGATGRRHPGIAVAVAAAAGGAPRLIWPADGRAWSRLGVLAWLQDQAARCRVLAGFDFSFAFPFVDLGCYFPGLADQPTRIRDLWAWIDTLAGSADDLGAAEVSKTGPLAAYFMTAKPAGARFLRRFRLSEHLCRELGLGNAQCVFHMIGPNQVGKASLSGMRLLHRLAGWSLWPMDRPTPRRSVVVELYTGLCIQQAGIRQQKIADAPTLDRALAGLGSPPADAGGRRLTDHGCDALVAAAWLRARSGVSALWQPAALSDKVRRTEGWVFGVQAGADGGREIP